MKEAINTPPSAHLVERIRASDRSAEEELIAHFGRGVGIILRATTRNRELADDLYQETFRIVIEKLRRGALREPEKLKSFLAGTARNLASDHRRRLLRQKTETTGDDFVRMPETAPDQLRRMLDDERSELVRQAIHELGNPRDRELLVRFHLYEENKADLCKDLSLTPRHFDRVLFRARQRYRKAYLAKVAENE